MKTLIVLCMVAVCWQATAKSERPNIVLLLIDDWAWYGSSIPMDEGMSNSRMPIIQMPNLEQMYLKEALSYCAEPKLRTKLLQTKHEMQSFLQEIEVISREEFSY